MTTEAAKLSIDIGRCGVSANETTLHPNKNLKKIIHYRSMSAFNTESWL